MDLRTAFIASLMAFWLTVSFSNRAHAGTPGAPVQLALNGVPCLPVCVGGGASTRTRAAAQELATVLGRMAGGTFTVATGNPAVFVGVPGDFSVPPIATSFVPSNPWRREEYLLLSDGASLYLIGATETAVEHAVWDLLGRLGYRLFFLTDTWEIVPTLPNLEVALDVTVQPDYHTRLAPRGSPWSDTVLWDRWRKRNRLASAFTLNTGHSYDAIISANAAAFAAHPEYYAMLDNIRQTNGSKFCISNPGLRQLVTTYAVGVMQGDPTRDSISMEPSDGGGWCDCTNCAAMGSVSDRVLWLANDVATAINTLGLGPRYVGMYAYNEHSPPPNIAGHSNVIVNVATSFIRGGYTIEELVEGWRASGVTIGIRDYHDVFTWSHDLPRRARGGDLAYLQRTIPYFHTQNARFMNSECSDSWGANGLGYWLSPLLLWDTGNAERIDDWVNDFLIKAFGAAEPAMREFYTLLNIDRSLQTDENVIARMYANLSDAYAQTGDAAVRNRLDDLTLYTRYVELYYHYRRASGEARQAGFEAVLRHAYRMRNRWMESIVAIYDRDQFRDVSVSVPPEADWSVPEPTNPWKDSTPYTDLEIATLITNGLADFPVDTPDFTPVVFSRHLVPPTPLNPPALAAGIATLTDRGSRRYYIWLNAPGAFNLDVRGGMITHYQDRGNVRVILSAWRDNALVPVGVDTSVPPDNALHTITLSSPYAGLHALEISDGSDMTLIVQPPGIPLTYHTPIDDPEEVPGTWTLYAYVPPRTTVFGGFASTLTGRLLDASGNVMVDFTQLERPGYFSVPVPAGRDGTFWKFTSCTGHRIPMTVPPCLAKTPAELLLPREVVYYTPPEPAFGDVSTMSATGVTQHAAWLTATLTATGAAPAEVTLHWGDGSGWQGEVALGTNALGPISASLAGLQPGTAYAYRFFAWHPYGSAWSDVYWFSTPNVLPFTETFENCTPGALHFQNGWLADPVDAAAVAAGSAPAHGGTKVGTLNAGRLMQSFEGFEASTNLVWTDLLLRPARSDIPPLGDAPALRVLPPDEPGTALFYVDYVTGLIIVYDGHTPTPLTSQPALAPGAWARFTVRSDYAAKRWDLWINGTNVVRNLAFVNAAQDRFAELAFDEPALLETPTTFDAIRIALEWRGRPPGIIMIDDDHDGICDDWERARFRSTDIADGSSDQDHDRFPDRSEFLADTDPYDATSRLTITAFEPRDNGETRLRWTSAENRVYSLIVKTNLADALWMPYLSAVAATAPTNALTLPAGIPSPAFFRIRLDAAP